MVSKGITKRLLRWKHVVDFLSSQEKGILDYAIVIRRFLGYLADKGLIATDVLDRMKHLRLPVKEKLPSVYLPEEILNIESSPDRGTSKGKRNYAVILLASRLGLRASDIKGLQFGNIDWEENVLRIIQFKTGKPLTLPLLNAVGEALIDYIFHGCPKSDSNFIFLRSIAPFEPITSIAITHIMRAHIQKSGMEIKGRHIGSHVLCYPNFYIILMKSLKIFM
jgi:integrase